MHRSKVKATEEELTQKLGEEVKRHSLTAFAKSCEVSRGSILTGIEKIRRWLESNPATEEVCGLLLDIDHDVQQAVRRITAN